MEVIFEAFKDPITLLKIKNLKCALYIGIYMLIVEGCCFSKILSLKCINEADF